MPSANQRSHERFVKHPVLTTLPLEKYFLGERGCLNLEGRNIRISKPTQIELCVCPGARKGGSLTIVNVMVGVALLRVSVVGVVMLILMMLPSYILKARKGWEIIHPSLHSGMQINSLMPANPFCFPFPQ